MSAPSWWKWEVTPGNVISWVTSVIAIVTIVVWLQADVRALQRHDEMIEKRVEKVENRAETDRKDIAEIKGDIRVIRQILEGPRNRP
jgi:hypothetical protein